MVEADNGAVATRQYRPGNASGALAQGLKIRPVHREFDESG